MPRGPICCAELVPKLKAAQSYARALALVTNESERRISRAADARNAGMITGVRTAASAAKESDRINIDAMNTNHVIVSFLSGLVMSRPFRVLRECSVERRANTIFDQPRSLRVNHCENTPMRPAAKRENSQPPRRADCALRALTACAAD